jgi:hypothetical protein
MVGIASLLCFFIQLRTQLKEWAQTGLFPDPCL